MKAQKIIAIMQGVVIGAGLASPVFAQDVGSDSSNADIVVTARRVEERLQDVPISITVLSQEQLANRNVVNALDLVNYTPSLSANSNFGADNTNFSLRGFIQDIGTPPSVGVYFADVVAPRAASIGVLMGDGAGPGNFFDLQNIQVLKGPQGTLFGRNTTGGAVLFVPQKPTHDLEGYVEGSIGNYDMKRVQAVLNLPLADTLRVRLAVDRQKRDGYLKNDSGIGPKNLADVDYLAVRGSLVADLTPDLENYTIFSYLHSDNNGTIQRLIACDAAGQLGSLACPQIAAANARGAGFYTVQNGVTSPRSRIDQWQVVNTTTWRASDNLTIKNIASYAELRNNLRISYGGSLFTLAPGQNVLFSTVQSPPGYDMGSQSTFVEELQIQGSAMGERLTFQAGGYYETSKPLGETINASPVLLSCANGSSDGFQCTDLLGIGFSAQSNFAFPVKVGNIQWVRNRTSFQNVGAYAQANLNLTQRLKLTAGLRYTWDEQQTRNELLSFTFPVTPPFTGPVERTCTDAASAPSCIITAKQSSNKPTWLVSLDYKPVDELMVYAKYARGYRAGGIFPTSPSNYRVFNPEKVDSYEAGLKATFNGAVRGYFNLSAFYNNFSNQQIQVGFNAAPGRSLSPTTGIVNAGRSRIYGAEVEASVSPFAGFTLDGSYTYLNATIREIETLVSSDPNYVVSAQVRPGDPLLLSPKHQATVTASYTLPLDLSIGKITFGATYSYIGKQLSSYDFNNPALLAAYGSNLGELGERNLVNLNLSWNSVLGSPIDVAAFATNVTNQKYYSFVPSFGSLGFYVATLGTPRMYGLRLRYRFGR
ncbi:TonB-dependent receptor [Novosphingobium sp. JCM 18896]|uniref:TonB-dependent receptor n=1 Tax=Novosphingobium sp. JCM 18896 TaxID=2989731 RepID=UPI002221B619|nr:TonB-dependent receptor [Novosphingobium sp. JCM 18896]MCW1431623.1 TonB-dependent receptor [Novosphingobium sp. JCM 18896]